MRIITVYKFTNVDDQEEYNFALFNDWDMSEAITRRGCDCEISTCDIEVNESLSKDEAEEYALIHAQDYVDELVWKLCYIERG